jgi:hypothetical protein
VSDERLEIALASSTASSLAAFALTLLKIAERRC